ncbi:hypothetical protein TrVE_jg3526 [Triparma verrucosa]|uniref:Uncharacterized protein n=1 Tax=Triparma verrucosa TaxID=1606542 RepID=A0A9W7EN34_9STRA|nr:hypothetical protein TrVE_jg3526 [Triparma verrucosa]
MSARTCFIISSKAPIPLLPFKILRIPRHPLPNPKILSPTTLNPPHLPPHIRRPNGMDLARDVSKSLESRYVI